MKNVPKIPNTVRSGRCNRKKCCSKGIFKTRKWLLCLKVSALTGPRVNKPVRGRTTKYWQKYLIHLQALKAFHNRAMCSFCLDSLGAMGFQSNVEYSKWRTAPVCLFYCVRGLVLKWASVHSAHTWRCTVSAGRVAHMNTSVTSW